MGRMRNGLAYYERGQWLQLNRPMRQFQRKVYWADLVNVLVIKKWVLEKMEINLACRRPPGLTASSTRVAVLTSRRADGAPGSCPQRRGHRVRGRRWSMS